MAHAPPVLASGIASQCRLAASALQKLGPDGAPLWAVDGWVDTNPPSTGAFYIVRDTAP